jgi:hypothetical protein
VRYYLSFSFWPNVATIDSRITEQPYKIPYYAAVLRLLHDPQDDGATTSGLSLGRQLLEDLWKRFHANVDKRAWRETRFYVGETVKRQKMCLIPFALPLGPSIRTLSYGKNNIFRLHGCPPTIIHGCLRGIWSISWSCQKGRYLRW